MGTVRYSNSDITGKFYMFAKANIDDEFNLYNIMYDHSLFIYPFEDQNIPSFINIVPEVATTKDSPTKEFLDMLYSMYIKKVKRDVEGFVINYLNNITKYVRMKNGKLVEYSEKEHKNEKKEKIS